VAEELGLTVALGADVDRRLLVDAHAEVVLTFHALPARRDLDRYAVFGFGVDRDAVDPDLHRVITGRFESGWEQVGDPARFGRVGDDELGPAGDLAAAGLWCGAFGHGVDAPMLW